VKSRITVERIFRSTQLFALCALVTALTPTPALFGISLIATGVFGMLMVGSLNAFIQEASPDRFNGRFVGIYLSTFTAGTTIGVIFVGLEAELINPRFPMIFGPSVTLFIGWLILQKKRSLESLNSRKRTPDSQ
jgi:MFS family permease